jgi:uncharacterized protein YggE
MMNGRLVRAQVPAHFGLGSETGLATIHPQHPMKICLRAIALLTLIPIIPVQAQLWETGKPLISVSGSAEIKVVPDEIYLNVGVETRDKDLQEAKQQNDSRISDALAFLKKEKLKDTNVKTDYINIQPVYHENNGAFIGSSSGAISGVLNTTPAYYIVRKTIGIKITEIAKFDEILSGLIASGVNDVQGVDFRTSQLRKYRDEARANAVKATREKAQAMADNLGVKLGKANNISENDFGGWNRWSIGNGWGQSGGGMYQNSIMNAAQDAGEAGSESSATSIGEISVSASVNVSFLIE